MILGMQKMANDTMLEIAFEKVGTKKIMANYAKLEKCNAYNTIGRCDFCTDRFLNLNITDEV